eukprot:TRINITY_DN12178_c0_g1_i1.p1 TRINITY_DN12178_c0_g1~~TRINITY_DN12178_c0_g1_i1.p1  ORF type:complete len:675 (+),score=162.55 TRINITY_DN12178_c0_g1_i1:110-2026(+)
MAPTPADKKGGSAALVTRIRGFQKQVEANRKCADCKEVGPTYICLDYMTFVCQVCSGIHREFGHKIKGISLSEWTLPEVQRIELGGNEKAAKTWLARWRPEDCPEPDSAEQDSVRTFIRKVYEDKLWVDPKASPAGGAVASAPASEATPASAPSLAPPSHGAPPTASVIAKTGSLAKVVAAQENGAATYQAADGQSYVEIERAQARFCRDHNSSEKRPKVEASLKKCGECEAELLTNYFCMAVCPSCSAKNAQCLICGQATEIAIPRNEAKQPSSSGPAWEADFGSAPVGDLLSGGDVVEAPKPAAVAAAPQAGMLDDIFSAPAAAAVSAMPAAAGAAPDAGEAWTADFGSQTCNPAPAAVPQTNDLAGDLFGLDFSAPAAGQAASASNAGVAAACAAVEAPQPSVADRLREAVLNSSQKDVVNDLFKQCNASAVPLASAALAAGAMKNPLSDRFAALRDDDFQDLLGKGGGASASAGGCASVTSGADGRSSPFHGLSGLEAPAAPPLGSSGLGGGYGGTPTVAAAPMVAPGAAPVAAAAVPGAAGPPVMSPQQLTQLDPQQLVQMQAMISQALHMQSQPPVQPQLVASKPYTGPVTHQMDLADFADLNGSDAESGPKEFGDLIFAFHEKNPIAGFQA